jgi:Tol biopolymer transport system component
MVLADEMVAHPLWLGYPVWSPDGKQLFYDNRPVYEK